MGLDIKAVVIGEGLPVQDLYGDWLRQREVDEDGVILIRPDKHIGWRANSMVKDPEIALFNAFSALLHR
jgi:2,4-dichlorophenol 6-monooxygenase